MRGILQVFLFSFVGGLPLCCCWAFHCPSYSKRKCSKVFAARSSSTSSQQDVVKDNATPSTAGHSKAESPALTSLILQVSYDGRHFSGWSAGNDDVVTKKNGNKKKNQDTTHPPRSSGRRRNRHLYSADTQNIRSVEGVLKLALAKVYGNIDPHEQIVAEGTSRTDKGVHATGMVALVYALQSRSGDDDDGLKDTLSVIPGKRLPHPRNATDASVFLPLPQSPDRLAFTLNRMLPPDIRIMQWAAPPTHTIFHASTSAVAKTYLYRVAVGPRMDPTQGRTAWYAYHVKQWNENAVTALIDLWTRQPHDFSAFAGAPRGADDRRKRTTQNTTCRLTHISCFPDKKDKDMNPGWTNFTIYTIRITGDRFLYKMVRFLVGTLVDVAAGRLDVEDVQTMLDTGVRPSQIVCAPAHGLVLEQVHYNTERYSNETQPLVWVPANS